MMTQAPSRTSVPSRLRRLLPLVVLPIGALLIASRVCFAQQTTASNGPGTPVAEGTPQPAGNKAPLTDAERAELLGLIRKLQERVDKLEAAQAANTKSSSAAAPVTSLAKVPADSDKESS